MPRLWTTRSMRKPPSTSCCIGWQIPTRLVLNSEERERTAAQKEGKTTVDSRKAASTALRAEVQKEYETGLNTFIETQVAAMKERGEYLPDFVLNDKWINPQTGKTTNLSSFAVKIYQTLNDKINNNPLHAAKPASLEVLGAGGKDARLAEIKRLQGLYLPGIFNAEIKRIQDGIRAASGQKPAAGAPPIARVEPNSGGIVQPQAMGEQQMLTWAREEAKKNPDYASSNEKDREEIVMQLYSRKRYGG
jgi:hypothetical protein